MLLLDEMLPDSIAATITAAGCDTVAVCAHPGLRGAPDSEVLQFATREGRILVTHNVQDFAPMSAAWAAADQVHPGIVMVSGTTFTVTHARSGPIAVALLARHTAGARSAPGQCEFLRPYR